MDKIILKEITKEEKEEKLKEIRNNKYYFGYFYAKEGKKITEEENKIVIESLKYNCIYNEFFNLFLYGEHYYFRGEVILKNKYLLVGIDDNILLFDILSGNQLKKYTILTEGKDNLYFQNAHIKKLNNKNDNEFFININGNIFLFRLTNENDLQIIATSYFNDIINLIKLDENNNKFYDNGDNKDSYYRNKNNNSVSIFY